MDTPRASDAYNSTRDSLDGVVSWKGLYFDNERIVRVVADMLKGYSLKRAIIVIIVFAIIISLFNIMNYQKGDLQLLNDLLPIELKHDIEILYSKNDHGFHGDGTSYLKVQLDDDLRKRLEADKANWKRLPVDNRTIEMENFFPADFPLHIELGFYYLRDLQPEMRFSDDTLRKPLWERSSYNFIFAILNSETNILYVLKLDT